MKRQKCLTIEDFIRMKREVEKKWENEAMGPIFMIRPYPKELPIIDFIKHIELFRSNYIILQVWFKTSKHRSRIGVIIDGLYDGLLQVQDPETRKIYIVAPDEIEYI